MTIKPLTTLQTCLALVAIMPLADVQAQTLISPALQDSKPAAREVKEQPKEIKIYPASEPDPAFRYRFWPAPAKRTNENPTPFVSRAVLLATQSSNDTAARTEFSNRFNEWSEMPLDELPREELRAFLGRFGTRALDELARSENHMRIEYDLQLRELSAPEMVETLLPEFQEMRQLSRLLMLRIRLAIVEQRWNDAVDDIRLGFRLAEVAGHSTDFLVGRLVGFAISGMMMNVTLEAMERPECPNLYWALASLPENRLFETRDSIEFESVLTARLIANLTPLPDHPIGADAARQRIREFAEQASRALIYSGDRGVNEFNAEMMSGIYVVTMADSARDLLATTTEWGEKARDLSPPEAVLRAIVVKVTRATDEWVKWSLLPSELWPEYEAEYIASVRVGSDRDILAGLVNLMTPAVDAARRAGLRTLQYRNMLSSIEAIRMHAAVTGELPQTIDKLRPVPCWDDGIAMKPFLYQRTSATTATLTRHERFPNDPESIFRIVLMKGNH